MSSQRDAAHRLLGNSYSFVPAFAVLLAVGMLAAQLAGAHGRQVGHRPFRKKKCTAARRAGRSIG
jgi:hypothetical protein